MRTDFFFFCFFFCFFFFTKSAISSMLVQSAVNQEANENYIAWKEAIKAEMSSYSIDNYVLDQLQVKVIIENCSSLSSYQISNNRSGILVGGGGGGGGILLSS